MAASSSSSSSFLDKLKAEVKRGEQVGNGGSSSQLPAVRHGDEDDAPEDSVVYEIYDPQLLRPDASLSPAAVASQLELLRCSLLSSLSPLLSSYLWHSAPFALSVSSSLPSHLRGVTHYGECVDDEYLIASLLLSLSSSHPSLLLRLHDHDGDFLLIDAAHALPRWAASPEHTRNRVWLQAGRICLLPPSSTTQEALSKTQALQLMMQRADTPTSQEEKAQEEAVNSAVQQRLQPYPQLALTHNSHCVRCLLPLSNARLLREDATAVSGAVSAFCTRDLIDMRAAHKMQAFLPAASPASSSSSSSSSPSPAAASLLTTVVPCRVRFSRLQYAHLDCQPFTLPRSILRHPALSSFASLPSSSPHRRAFTLGMKLMAGMEMQLHSLRQRQQRLQRQQQQLVQRQQEEKRKREQREQGWRAKGGMTEEEAERQMRGDGGKRRRWRRHLEQLQQLGFFRGAKRGTSEWKEKVLTGWLMFEEEEERQQQDSGEQQPAAAGLREDELQHLAAMERAVSLSDGDVVELKAEVDQWSQWEALPADDSEDWLKMDEQQLQEIIAQRERADREAGGRRSQSQPQQDGEQERAAPNSNTAEAAALSAAQSMVRGMKDFIATVSGHEGAELPAASHRQSKAERGNQSRSEEKHEHKQPHRTQEEDERLRRVTAVLHLPEREMLGGMLQYDAEFGQGSFERHLTANAPELGLDAVGDAEQEGRQEQAGTEEGGEEEEGTEDDEGDDDDEDGSFAEAEGVEFEGEAGSLTDYLAAMTRQLQSAGIGQEFEQRQKTAQEQKGDERGRAGGDGDEEEQQGMEVDADLNLLSNLLSSVEAQHGQAGPGSNLMSAMGISIPKVTKAETKAAGKDKTAPAWQ